MTMSPLRAFILMCALFIQASITMADDSGRLDDKAIGQAAGTQATAKPDGVVRIGWKRDDVPVTVDGMKFPPPAGLGSWAAFKALPEGGVMVMGDTVVFEDEITPAMDAAFAHGHGRNAESLAEGVKAMWDAIKQVRKKHPVPQERFPGDVPDITGKYNTKTLEKILDAEGSLNGQVLKFTFGRSARMHGVEFGASMGLSTWAAFSGNEKQAVVDGDFAMTADEIQPVMRALRQAGIHIVALHNHMTGETPSYYFLHYWGKGQPEDLAKAIRAALETQR